jgi:predicted KAP-like P-loop ATPase
MATTQKWSAKVTKHSDALDLTPRIFAFSNPKTIARSLSRSAETSMRRKAEPFRSAMSMLTFYINRAGKNLSPVQKHKLESAKRELRRLYQR